MERAPLPPHERSWRHPSEIGPSRHEIDADAHGRPVLLAAGALAAIMLVAMVVVLTPRPTSGPVAISATTAPVVRQTTTVPRTAAAGQIISVSRAPRLASFSPIPNAIAAAPVVHESTVTVAASLPRRDEVVHVKTETATYRVEWGDVEFLQLDERAIVVDRSGELVARIEAGEIVVLVGD